MMVSADTSLKDQLAGGSGQLAKGTRQEAAGRGDRGDCEVRSAEW